MDGVVFAVTFSAVAGTAVQDFFELNAAAGKPLSIHGFNISQNTEEGDAQDELLHVRIRRGQTSSGSGGSAPTPVPLNPSAAASSFTAEANNTTQASGGTIVVLYEDAMNVRAGLPVMFPPELRPKIAGGGRGTLELVDAPADSITFNGTIWVEEIG